MTCNQINPYLTRNIKINPTKCGIVGVISVFPCQKSQVQTTRSWDFMGLSQSIERRPAVESDIIVGVIDTGIWPESESFNDEGFGPIPAKWKGVCNGGKDFVCNRKIIGERTFSIQSRDLSTRDESGHGTHVASIISGSEVRDASYYGIAEGIARGGVPSARIAAYKVCSLDCYDTDILTAFDHAIADGVDLISISIAFQEARELTFDPIAIGAFHAMERGILTVNAAGNEGPYLYSIKSYAPWILTVAAGDTNRRIIDKVLLGKDAVIVGNAINAFPSSDESLSLVYGNEVTNNCTETEARNCLPKCLESSLVEKKVILCDQNKYIKAVKTYGALGCIVPCSISDNFSAVMPFPVVALTPGVEILAAFSPIAPPSGHPWDMSSARFSILSGTSMACPHVTAAAIFVKSFHPEWSPSAIKSALMTTAWELSGSLHPEAEFAFGSGHIDPLKATNPGLVYETSFQEYLRIWCNISQTVVSAIPTNASCPMTLTPKELNYPSMAVHLDMKNTFTVSFHRTVTNVGHSNSTYVASIEGDHSNMHISVKPNTLHFTALNEKMNFVVTIRGRRMKPFKIKRMSLLWTDGIHRVRSPIVFYTTGTSGGERTLVPSRFHMTFVILMIVILVY
ncbi:hypothetical protein M8C21_025530 [Ambrosia artemisiifolia]|uniref:Uncharacterized protein n=1 Tax=Ambrosia artemisiifolia TaxID=4212 RepID=A0AAD5CJA0_AMBAR|nr:hypothetical protein M8C21_025530 [Ambrosia artemisiifolia]